MTFNQLSLLLVSVLLSNSVPALGQIQPAIQTVASPTIPNQAPRTYQVLPLQTASSAPEKLSPAVQTTPITSPLAVPSKQEQAIPPQTENHRNQFINQASTAPKQPVPPQSSNQTELPKQPSTAPKQPVSPQSSNKTELPKQPSTAPEQPVSPQSSNQTELPKQPSTAPKQPVSPQSSNKTELPKQPSTAPEQPVPQKTDSSDELFQKVFGRAQAATDVQRVIVPFFINDRPYGQLVVSLSPGATPAVRAQAAPLLRATSEIVRPELQSKLQAAIETDGTLILETLRQNGLVVVFDNQRLELRIQVPPAQRKTSVYDIQASNLPPEAKDAITPSRVSGYLNLRASEEFVWSGSASDLIGRQPLNLDLEGAVNINGWVLEGSATFTENRQPQEWVRGDLRLVHDDPANGLRYVLGDLSIPVTGYQSSRPQLGIAVARNFSLQPYRVTRPIGQFQFFLERPSKVEVFSNGRLVRTLQLPAGMQDIRNLSLNAGINDVQLVITDEVGRVQRLDFSRAYVSSLLAPGLEQFAYSLGFPTTSDHGIRSYDWSLPTLTLAHRWGINRSLTLGGYLQANFEQQLIGIEGSWASSFGNLGWDVAFSHDQQVGSDYAFRLRYDYLKTGLSNPSERTFGVALEYRGAHFKTLGDNDLYRNDTRLDITAYYSQKLFWDIYGTLNFRYQFGRDVADSYQASLRLSRSFSSGLGVNLTLSDSHGRDGQDEQRAVVNLSWLLPKQRQSFQTTTEISNKSPATNRLNWNYSSPNPIGGINASIELAQTPNSDDFSGRLAYTGSRATFEVEQELHTPHDEDGNVSNSTRFKFGTALVFADGRWGWSRPVNGSFALLSPSSALKGQFIGINPNISGGYAAQIDRAGAAVIPDLQAYQVSTLQIEAPNLPLGYQLGSTRHHLLPTYKSGTLIQIGSDATVFLRGTLLDEKENPIALQTGEIISLSDTKWQPISLFTNKAGKFALEGLKPGRYELKIYSEPRRIIRFEIPPGKSGLHDLGILKATVPTNDTSKKPD